MDESAHLQEILSDNKSALFSKATSDSPENAAVSRFLCSIFSGLLSTLAGDDIGASAGKSAASARDALFGCPRSVLLDSLNEVEHATMQVLESTAGEASGPQIARLCRFFCESRRLLSGLQVPVDISADRDQQDAANACDRFLKVNSFQVEGHMCIDRDATEEAEREAEFRRLHESMIETNRKLEESVAQLKAAQAKLVQTEKLSALGQLISGTAHELNNPLTGIVGYTQLLLERVRDERHRQDLRKVNQAALRCRHIIQNLLRFSRDHKPQKQCIDIHSVVQNTADLKRYQLRLDGITLNLRFSNDQLQVIGDSYQIQQVLLNILSNAHQSIVSGKTGGTIEVQTQAEKGAGRARVSISDDGPGIRPDVLPRIFDPFFTTKEVGDGTGLGLSVAYGIMREHNGQITAESIPFKRTLFHLDFPLAADDVPAKEREQEAHAGLTSKILIVDDEEVILDLLTDILTQMDRHVESARNGAEALAKIGKDSFDIIICDLKMPGMDGKTFYHKMKESHPELAGKIIFSTGDTLSEEFRAFCAKTECHVVEKPFLLEDLKKAVDDLERDRLREIYE